MSDIKFSQLTVANNITASDFIAIVRSGSASGPNGSPPNNYIVQAQYFTASWSQNSISSSVAKTASYFNIIDLVIPGNFQVIGTTTINNATGSLFGTSSWSNKSLTASFVDSNAISGTVTSASYAVSSSYALSSSNSLSSSYALSSSNSLSSSYALSSSNSLSSSYALTSSNALTSSYIVSDVLPVGMIVNWPTNILPDNWLECTGSSINTTTYSRLFNVIGYTYGGSGVSFNLPDLRGRFVRGLDDGTTSRDPDSRTIGSTQEDSFKSHTHNIITGSVVAFTAAGPFAGYGQSTFNAPTGFQSTTSTGSSETRPKNMALKYIIYCGRL